MTVSEYYKGFGSIFGGITTVIGVLPVVSKAVPDDVGSVLFPPLDWRFAVMSLILAWLITLPIYFLKSASFVSSTRQRVRCLCCLILLAGIGVGLFLVTWSKFVRVIEIEPKKESVTLSVGFERSEFANREFPGSDDWELLRNRGPIEEEVWRLWTYRSIVLARLGLLGSYLTFFLSAIAAGSLAVLYELLGVAPNP